MHPSSVLSPLAETRPCRSAHIEQPVTELRPEHLGGWSVAYLHQVKAENLLIIPATSPKGKIFPSPFPSLFIPTLLNTQQLSGPALCVPTMITTLGCQGEPRERGGNLQVLWIDLFCIPTLRGLPVKWGRSLLALSPPFPFFSSLLWPPGLLALTLSLSVSHFLLS